MTEKNFTTLKRRGTVRGRTGGQCEKNMENPDTNGLVGCKNGRGDLTARVAITPNKKSEKDGSAGNS